MKLHQLYVIVTQVVFFLKYVPTGMYMYKLLKSVYQSSRERIYQKQIQLEDIQLQVATITVRGSVSEVRSGFPH